MAVGGDEDPVRPALVCASQGHSPSPETGSGSPRATLDRPLYLWGLGLPIWKMGWGLQPRTEEASAEARQAMGPGGGLEKVSRDRMRSEVRGGKVSQALKLASSPDHGGQRGLGGKLRPAPAMFLL